MKVRGRDVFHRVASIEHPRVRLTDFGTGTWMWAHLREAFPEALGAVLMAAHPHLLSPLDSPENGRARMNRLLGQLARRVGLRHVGVAPLPKWVQDRGKLSLDCRYLALNPCRKRLAGDPLRWWFSTHRDILGAIVDPWVTADRLATALGRRRSDFRGWYHGYVSSAPCVHVAGTATPTPARPTVVAAVPLATIARAVAVAIGPVRRHAASRAPFGISSWRWPGSRAGAASTNLPRRAAALPDRSVALSRGTTRAASHRRDSAWATGAF